MKFSDDLYQLIHALSPSEKRYVKITIKAFSAKGTDNQLALFNAFERQASFDESKIRKKLDATIPLETFHLSKNRLYKLIIKALYLYHSQNSTAETISQNLFQANILLEKGLLKQAKKLNEKAAKKAAKTGNHLLVFESYINSYYQNIEGYNLYNTPISQQNNQLEELEVLDYYKNDLIYFFLQRKFMEFKKQNPSIRDNQTLEALRILKNNPYLNEEEVIKKSERTKQICLSIRGYIYQQENYYDKAIASWKQLLPDFKTIKLLPQTNINTSILNIENLMLLYLKADKIELAKQLSTNLLEFLKHNFIRNSNYMQFKIESAVIAFNLKLFLYTKAYDEGLHYLESSFEHIENVYANSNSFKQLTLLILTTNIYIATGNSEKAMFSINKSLDHEQLKKHPHLRSQVFIQNLLIHFELKNYLLLQSLMPNSYRTLQKDNLIFETEAIIFKFIKTFIKSPSDIEQNTFFNAFLEEIELAQQDVLEQNFMPFFHFPLWVKSQASRKNMSNFS